MSDRRGIRYPMPVIVRARELDEAGWTPAEIVNVLESEHGVRPHRGTVQVWVNERRAVHRRQQALVRQRRADAKRAVLKIGAGRKPSTELVDELVRRLGAEGVRPVDIVRVTRVFLDEPLTLHQVRYRLRVDGPVQKYQRKVAA